MDFSTLALKVRDAKRMGCPEKYVQALTELKAKVDGELAALLVYPARQRPQDVPDEEDRSWDTHPLDYRRESCPGLSN